MAETRFALAKVDANGIVLNEPLVPVRVCPCGVLIAEDDEKNQRYVHVHEPVSAAG